MQPNTPHFVFGTHNSICYGGHFYSTSGMQQTLAGVVHSFMLDKFITNTAHQASRQLLRRILIFYLHGLMDKKISAQGMYGRGSCNSRFLNSIMIQIALGFTSLTWRELMV